MSSSLHSIRVRRTVLASLLVWLPIAAWIPVASARDLGSEGEVRERLARVQREAERLGVRIVRLRGQAVRWGSAGRSKCLEATLPGTTSIQRRIAWFFREWRQGRRSAAATSLLHQRIKVIERDLHRLRERVRHCLVPHADIGLGRTLVEVTVSPPFSGDAARRWALAHSR